MTDDKVDAMEVTEGQQPRKRVRFAENLVQVKDLSPAPEIEDDDDELYHEQQIIAGSTMQDVLQQLTPDRRKAFLHDLGAAEEDFIESDDPLYSEEGIPLEPFNLRRERAEGYFTEDGTYVWHKPDRDAEADAWIDSLPEAVGEEDDEDDLADAQEGATQLPGGMPLDVAVASRQEIISMLHPHENVLDALKRLGSTVMPQQGGFPGAPQLGPGASREARAEAKSAWRKHLQQRMQTGKVVPPENRAAFDRLTALSSTLMDAGDIRVYTDSKEQLQARAGTPAGTHGGPLPVPWATVAAPTGLPGVPFGFQGPLQGPGPFVAPAAGVVMGSSGMAAAPPQPLLPVLPLNVPSTISDALPNTVPVDPEEDIFAETDEKDLSTSSPARKRPTLMHANAKQQRGTVPMRSASLLGTTPVTASAAGSSVDAARVGSTDDAAGMSQAELVAVADDTEMEGQGPTDDQGTPPGAPPGTPVVGSDEDMEDNDTQGPGGEWVLDTDSGLYYDSLKGKYWDPSRGLLGDANTGHWFAPQQPPQGVPVAAASAQ